MEPSGQGAHQFSLRFNDFEELAEATRGWDLDYWQLDSGPFAAEHTQIQTPSVILNECAYSRKIHQRGAPPAGHRTFAFAANQGLDLMWRGKTVSSEDLMLFPPGSELESISQPGFHIFAISIADGALEEAASRRGLDSVRELLPATDLISCRDDALAKIRLRAGYLSRTAASGPSIVNDRLFREGLEIDLVDSVLDAIATGSGIMRSFSVAPSRTRLVKRAIEIIADRAEDRVTVAEIARLTGITDRTLRTAFEESVGISPKQYIQAYRLNSVHRLLRHAREQGQNVADVANSLGFWHMGQFARDYRKMFGVLPRQTMRLD